MEFLLDLADDNAEDAFWSSVVLNRLYSERCLQNIFSKSSQLLRSNYVRDFYMYNNIKDKNQKSKEIDFIQAIAVGRVPQIRVCLCRVVLPQSLQEGIDKLEMGGFTIGVCNQEKSQSGEWKMFFSVSSQIQGESNSNLG